MKWKEDIDILFKQPEYTNKIALMWNTFSVYYSTLQEGNDAQKIGTEENVLGIINGYLEHYNENDLNDALDFKCYRQWILNDIRKGNSATGNNSETDNTKELLQKINIYVEALFGQYYKKAMYEAIKANEGDDYHFFYEIIQNADDCKYSNLEEGKIPEFTVEKYGQPENNNKILFKYNEDGMSRSDVIALCSLYDSNKNVQGDAVNNENISNQQIGEKGQGFKTVFKVAKVVEIKSGNYHFKMTPEQEGSGQNIGVKICLSTEGLELTNNDYKETQILLTLWDEEKDFHKNYTAGDVLENMQKRYFGFAGNDNNNVDENKLFSNCPILFTKNINTLKIGKYELKKEENTEDSNLFRGTISCNNTNLQYFRYKEEVTFGEEECKSRYGEYSKDKTKDIQIVVPYKVDNNNIVVDEEIEGTLYSFLPTDIKVNVPMNIHIPAFLNENRSDIKSENNGKSTIRWNEHIIERLFGIKKAENEEIESTKGVIQNFLELICKEVETKELIKLIPANDLFSEESAITKILKNKYKSDNSCYKKAKIFRNLANDEDASSNDEYICGCEAFIFDEVIKKLGIESAYFSDMKNDGFGLNDKQLIGYVEGIKVIIEKCGITSLENIEDKNKVKILNAVYSQDEKASKLWVENEVESLGKFLVFSDSVYLPSDKKKLEIYPYYFVGNAGIEVGYTSIRNEELWIKSDCDSENELPQLSLVRFWAGKSYIENWVLLCKKENNKINITPIMDEIGKNDWQQFYEVCLYLSKKIYNNENWVSFVETCIEKDKDNQNIIEPKKIENKLKAITIPFEKNSEETTLQEVKQNLIALQIKCKKANLQLPPYEHWNEKICEELDKIGFFTKEKNIPNLPTVEDKNNESNEEDAVKTKLSDDYFKQYELKIKNLKIHSLGCEKICVCFAGNIIINKEAYEKNSQEKIFDEIVSKISSGTATAIDNNNQLDKIKKAVNDAKNDNKQLDILSDNNDDDVIKNIKKCAELMQKITIVDALNSANGLIRNDKKEGVTYGDNVIAYELLQNVNDCKKRSKERSEEFTRKNVQTGNDLDITILRDKKTKIRLEYAEAGFTAVDLLAICTLENTGNYNSTESTGHKGTGFKCIYNVSDDVVIETNHFTIRFKLDEHPNYTIDVEDGKIKLENNKNAEKDEFGISWEKWEDENKPKYPVPGFAFTEERETTCLTLTKKDGAGEEFEYLVTRLKDPLSYVFLSEIRNIGISEKDKQWTISIKDELLEGDVVSIKENGSDIDIAKHFCMTINENPKYNSNDKKNTVKFDHYMQICANNESPFEVLFPESELTDILAMYYCDLPMIELKDKYGFIVNMGHRIEPDDNRKTYTYEGNNKDIKGEEQKWFIHIFKHYADKDYKRALKFYPNFELNDDSRYGYDGIDEVMFLPAKKIDDNSECKCSVKSILSKETLILDNVIKKWCELIENQQVAKNALKEQLNEKNIYFAGEVESIEKVNCLKNIQYCDVEGYFDNFNKTQINKLLEVDAIKTFIEDLASKKRWGRRKRIMDMRTCDYKVPAIIMLEKAQYYENTRLIDINNPGVANALKDMKGYIIKSNYKNKLKNDYNLTDDNQINIVINKIIDNRIAKLDGNTYDTQCVQDIIRHISDKDSNRKDVLGFLYDQQNIYSKNIQECQKSKEFFDELLGNNILIQKRLLPSESNENPYIIVGSGDRTNKEWSYTDEKSCYWTYTDARDFNSITLVPEETIKKEIVTDKYIVFEYENKFMCSINDIFFKSRCFELKNFNLTYLGIDKLLEINDDDNLQKALIKKMFSVKNKEIGLSKTNIEDQVKGYKAFMQEMSKFFKESDKTEIFNVLLKENKTIIEKLNQFNVKSMWHYNSFFYRYIDAYNNFYKQSENNTSGRLWFVFSENGSDNKIRKLSLQEKINIYLKMPSSIKEKKFDIFGSEMTAGDIIENKVYICECSENNQSKYLFAKKKVTEEADNQELEDIIVVMGTNSLRKFLKEEFGLSGYGEPKHISEMVSFPEDELEENQFDDDCCNLEAVFPDSSSDNIALLSQLENMENEEIFKNRLSSRYDLETTKDGETIFYSFKGYGKVDGEKDKTPKCPICHAALTAEINSIYIKWLTIGKLKSDENNLNYIVAPFIMCGNCKDAFDASTNVSVFKYVEDTNTERGGNAECSFEELTTEYLRDTNKVEVCFSRNGRLKPIIYKMDLTLLHRKIIYDILDRETQNKSNEIKDM